MGAISLYRGNLHRIADMPRRWPMPQRAISLTQFRDLLRKRNLAISRFAAGNPNLNTHYLSAGKGDRGGISETVCPREVSTSLSSQSEPRGSDAPSQLKNMVEADAVESLNDCQAVVAPIEDLLAGADLMEVTGMEVGCGGDGYGKEEVIFKSVATDEKEARKRDFEKQLDVLNAKKHYLVQMLKLILNAEEEIKRRSIQPAAARSFAPPQADAFAQTSCAARNPPKLSDVNFGGDPGGESDATAAANQTIQARQWPPMPTASPSLTSIGKSPHPSFQNNMVRTPRGSMPPHPSISSGSLMANFTGSPSCFIPSSSSIPGTHFAAASSLSPAASGGTSSPFRDFRMK